MYNKAYAIKLKRIVVKLKGYSCNLYTLLSYGKRHIEVIEEVHSTDEKHKMYNMKGLPMNLS